MGYLDNIKRAPSEGASGSSNYMKFNQGENKFRIIGTPDDKGFINGMLGWADSEDGKRKPYRWRIGVEAPRKFEEKPKEFFAIKVYNYETASVQILEITQRGLKDDLTSYIADEEWGDPRKYDIAVIKSGEGLETRYAMVPKPHKKMSAEQITAIKESSINLEALYDGADPFEPVADEPAGEEEDPF